MESTVVSHRVCGSPIVSFTEDTSDLLCRSALALRNRAVELANDDSRKTEKEACILSCVITAAGWSEAFINGLYADCEKNPKSEVLAKLGEEQIGLLAEWWTNNQGKRFYKKCEHFLKAVNVPELNEADGSPASDRRLLSDLRNALVHAEPIRSANWQGMSEESRADLRKKLDGKFAFNSIEGNCSVLNRVLSVECACWAIDAAKRFNDHFADLINVPRPSESRFRS